MQIPTAGDFKIQNQHVATLIYNALNGLFESQKTSLNALLDETQTNFDNEKAQSALIFYLFLGAYILLVVAQAPLGYHIIRSANQEAMPFLSISRRHYIKMVKEANSFLIYIRVPG
ncbi:MAG: hypothetical protein P4M11_04045 [Candidatus Pacebacteria bacterium]|nr:hypothetical protein [Candidatus Paceibacterota bacterium]